MNSSSSHHQSAENTGERRIITAGAAGKSQRLDRVPKDPWGHPYQYQHPGQHGDIDVFSLGADGKPGGDGEAADIGNWDQ